MTNPSARNNFDLLGTITDATQWVDKTYETVQQKLAPLTPFVDSMKKVLQRAGVKVPDNPAEIAELYARLTRSQGQGQNIMTASGPNVQTKQYEFSLGNWMQANPELMIGGGALLLVVLILLLK